MLLIRHSDLVRNVAKSPVGFGCLLFSCLLLCSQGYAQQTGPGTPGGSTTQPDARDRNLYVDTAATSGSVVKRMATNIVLDQKKIWTSPLHIDRSSAKWWILTGAGTAALLAADHPLSQSLPFSGNSVRTGTDLSRLGQWYSVFPFAGGMYSIGRITNDPKLEETGALGVQALADAGITVNVLKVVTRRERPGGGDHGGHFEKGGAAFPSGHSTESWALASVIAHEYGDHRWVPFAAYGYASMVSVSRLLAQEHFASDVLVGSAIGFFIGRYVVHTNQVHLDHARRAKWLSPAISPIFNQGASAGGHRVAVNLNWSM